MSATYPRDWPSRTLPSRLPCRSAFAAQAGLAGSEEKVNAVIGVGVALILGIAHEDSGKWRAGEG